MEAVIQIDIQKEIQKSIAPLMERIDTLLATIEEKQDDNRLLNLKEVIAITGIKTTSIYLKMKTGEFPKPIKVGNSSRWKKSDIMKWIEQK